MLQQVQVPNGWKKVRTALEWTLWMEGLLLSAAAMSRNRVYQNREAQMQYLLLPAAAVSRNRVYQNREAHMQ
jgi:hypothetical protein